MFLDKYVTLTNKKCHPLYMSFPELHVAKSACNNISSCGGVQDHACDEDGSYSLFELCDNSYSYSIFDNPGSTFCVYKKTSKLGEFLLFLRNIFHSLPCPWIFNNTDFFYYFFL